MINMMKDILQYVPYALFLGAIFLLLAFLVAVTINHFRKAERRTFPESKVKKSAA